MFCKAATIVSAVLVLCASQAMSAALIAGPTPGLCGPSQTVGSTCKYYSGPSENDPIVTGTCVDKNGVLTCVAN
ncbi:hypothetical protein PM082_007116 [Marasmius tenuissimus]|nr:hypothetical protein PM082_007116 [Marasmius tenuissimus]